jgi:DNA repair protein RadC
MDAVNGKSGPPPRPTIKSMPEQERPRERLISGGDEQLSDCELLAIIIRDGTPEASALELARTLISKYETFRAMSAASIADLCAVKGIGPAKAAQIKAALAIARRFAQQKLAPGKRFGGSRDVFEYFCERLRDEKKETFWSVLLDQKNKIIKVDPVSVGSLAESLVHPREVFRNAVRESAASVLFVHNHPSGDPRPSPEDIEITKKLALTGDIVGIKVLDHVIIGGEEFVSMKGQGMM